MGDVTYNGEAADSVQQAQAHPLQRSSDAGRPERNPGASGQADCPPADRQGNGADNRQAVQVEKWVIFWRGGSWGEFYQFVPENYLNIPNL
jgi:hypothetical protein